LLSGSDTIFNVRRSPQGEKAKPHTWRV
jgi:hypothetical protein